MPRPRATCARLSFTPPNIGAVLDPSGIAISTGLIILTVLIFALLLLQANNVLAVIVSLVAIAGGGTLFWFMVKAMARIQMPERH